MRHRVARSAKDPIKFLCVVVVTAFAFVLCFSVIKLHQLPLDYRNATNLSEKLKMDSTRIGKLGEMVIEMLPQDMGFTLFLPSEKAFVRDLGLNSSDVKGNDTYAILTRVLGFSAVPRMIYSGDVVQSRNKEIDYDSISGYTLYIWKDSNGALIVNRIVAEMVDLRRGKIVVHVIDGVIMDPEFAQSVQPDSGDDDD